MKRLLLVSRLAILLAVLGNLAAFVILLAVGVLKAGKSLWTFVAAADLSSLPIKTLALGLIEVADLFLLATVFYLMSVGLYEL
ncbi:MAG TPA: YqhA family protein, partial [Thermoanaerobaculia bacterium]|nr:YqhA family protein [Thermoanaerobaculia bacterium]